MAQKVGHLMDFLKSKLSLVISQKEDLQGSIEAYVEKMTSPVKSALETQIPDVKTITAMNSELEKVLVFLLEFGTHVDGVSQEDSDSEIYEENPTALPHVKSKDKQEADIDRRYNTRLQKIEEKFNEMETKYDKVMTQGDSRMDKIEKRVKKLETGGKLDVSRLDKVVMDMETLKPQFGTSQRQLSKIETIDDQVQKLTSDYSSLQNHGKEIQHLKKVSDSLVSKMDTLAAKDDLNGVKEDVISMTRSVIKLSTKTDEIESSLTKSVSEMQEETRKTKRLEDRISEVEPCKSKLEEVEKSLQDLTKKVTDTSKQVSVIESKHHVPGFTARLSDFKTMSSNIIIPFDNVTCNDGNNFMYDTQTGKLTAQRDGLYATAITMVQPQGSGQGSLWTKVVKFSPGGREENVSFVFTGMGKTSSCVVGVVRLKTGDQVYCKVHYLGGNVVISDVSSFSCFMIGQ